VTDDYIPVEGVQGLETAEFIPVEGVQGLVTAHLYNVFY
jgi:hypothetical protein